MRHADIAELHTRQILNSVEIYSLSVERKTDEIRTSICESATLVITKVSIFLVYLRYFA